jgi:hypothetical protein
MQMTKPLKIENVAETIDNAFVDSGSSPPADKTKRRYFHTLDCGCRYRRITGPSATACEGDDHLKNGCKNAGAIEFDYADPSTDGMTLCWTCLDDHTGICDSRVTSKNFDRHHATYHTRKARRAGLTESPSPSGLLVEKSIPGANRCVCSFVTSRGVCGYPLTNGKCQFINHRLGPNVL